MRLILASGSPQRRELLEGAGLRFEVEVADVEELGAGNPREVALANAVAKAEAVAGRRPGGDVVVLAADTVVDIDGEVLGKPLDVDDARRMVGALAGRRHEVHTAVAVIGPAGLATDLATSEVGFREVDDHELEAHLELGEWQGRAGGYAIQQSAARFLSSLDGDLDTVIGLPMGLLASLLPDGVQPE